MKPNVWCDSELAGVWPGALPGDPCPVVSLLPQEAATPGETRPGEALLLRDD